MTQARRKCWAIPDKVFDILENKPSEFQIAVIRAIRAYAQWWSEHRSEEGFDFDMMPLAVQQTFFRIYDDLHDVNQHYYEKCAVLSENATAGAAFRMTQKRKAKRQQSYYANNRDIINERRRKAYNSKKTTKNAEEMNSVQPQDAECHTKNESVIRNVGRNVRRKSPQEQGHQGFVRNIRCQAKRHTKSKNNAKKVLDDCIQRLENLSTEENPANADKDIGLNNIPSLCSEILLEWGFGGKPSYPQPPVDKFLLPEAVQKPPEIPTSGLSGSKAVQTGRSVPVCSKAVAGSRETAVAVAVGQSGIESSRAEGQSGNCSKAVDGGKPPSSAKMDYAPPAVPETNARSAFLWKSAPHEPGADEVRITKDFRIDFRDKVFKPYARADMTVRRGLEDWLIDKKLGCSVEKTWICKQIYKFARNQGKHLILMGVEE